MVIQFFLTLSCNGDVSLSLEQNYMNWGWNGAYVFSNGIIKSAVYPQLGGRIMQYDLGDESLLWVNPNQTGRQPQDGGEWINFGGFKNWPAPQAQWDWPPPPLLDGGEYTPTVVEQTVDSIVFFLEGPVEQNTSASGLRFNREMRFYENTSRVRIEQRLLNVSCDQTEWSVWDITQVLAGDGQNSDHTDYWAYFPRASSHSVDSYFFLQDEESMRPQLKPGHSEGIDAFAYSGRGGKIGITTDEGWIAYVNERSGTAYIKKTTIEPNADYPDQQSMFQIYSTNASGNQTYIEIEALSPIRDIQPGDSAVYTVDWYLTHVHGPIIGVNDAGAIRERISVSRGIRVKGKYGVFYAGRVDLVNAATVRKTWDVSPLDSFIIDETFDSDLGSGTVSLLLYDSDGNFIDTLDRTKLSVSQNHTQSKVLPRNVMVDRFNRAVNFIAAGNWSVKLFDLQGKEILGRHGNATGAKSVPFRGINRGTYICCVREGNKRDAYWEKIVLFSN